MQLKLNLFQSQMPYFNEIYMYYYFLNKLYQRNASFMKACQTGALFVFG